MPPPCVECGVSRPGDRRRGLCIFCYRQPLIRRRYPRLRGNRPARPTATATCHYCRSRPAARRRLCAVCDTDPNVRDCYSDGECGPALTDAEILAMPVMPFGDCDPAPPAYTPDGERKRRIDGLYRWSAGRNGCYDLHPSTSPAAIADLHWELVQEAAEELGRDVDAISEAVCLPRWSVERALGIAAVPGGVLEGVA